MIKKGKPSRLEEIGQSLSRLKMLKDMSDDITAGAKEDALKKFNQDHGQDLDMKQWEALDSDFRVKKKEVKEDLEKLSDEKDFVATQAVLNLKRLAASNPGNLSMDADGYYIYKAKGLGSVKYKPQEFEVRIPSQEVMTEIFKEFDRQGLDAFDFFLLEKGEMVFNKEAYLALNEEAIEHRKRSGIKNPDPLPGIYRLEENEVAADSYKVSISSSRR